MLLHFHNSSLPCVARCELTVVAIGILLAGAHAFWSTMPYEKNCTRRCTRACLVTVMQWHRHVSFALLDCEKRLARMEQPHGEPDELYRTPNIETLTVVMLYPMLECRDIHLHISHTDTRRDTSPDNSSVIRHHRPDITYHDVSFCFSNTLPESPPAGTRTRYEYGSTECTGGRPRARSANASPAQRGSLPGNEGCE